MKNLYKRLDQAFSISLILSFLLFVLPPELTYGVYSPNYVGWFWLIILIPALLISFVWLSALDYKSKNKKILLKRVFIFLGVILLSIIVPGIAK